MKVLSTDGLTKLIQLIKSAFISVDDTVTTTTVELADVATTGDYDDLINTPAEVTESTVSGWGFTKNTGTVTSVNNVSPVNGNVTLSIPAAQVNSDWNATSGKAEILNKPNLATVATSGSYNDLTNKPTIPTVNDATLTIQKNGTDVQTFSANASSNVTANITVPTAISDLTDDTSTTPIDKADTLTGLTASVMELNYVDGVTSNIQTQIDGKVSKSGDTMTDNLTISKDGVTPKLILTNTSFDPTSTTAPEANQYCGALEWQGEDDYLTGFVRNRHNASNNFQTQIGIRRKVNGSDIEAVLNVGINASGEAVCSFPKSYNVDGQWVISNLTLANSVAVSSSNVTYSLASYLPDDGYNYEVLLAGSCSTDAVSGHFSRIIVLSDLVGDYVNMMQVRTRTASTVDAAGNCIIPVGVGRTITFVGSTSNNFAGTYTLVARAYRRIGTNS